MTDGFQVTMSRLCDAAARFRAGAETLAGALSASGPAPVNAGSPAVNDALSMVLESAGLLNTTLDGTLADSAAGLAATCRLYRHAEDETTRLTTPPSPR